MISQQKSQLRIFGIIFLGCILSINAIYAISILIFKPTLRWINTGTIDFSATANEIFLIILYANSLSIFVALVIWLEGKYSRRW